MKDKTIWLAMLVFLLAIAIYMLVNPVKPSDEISTYCDTATNVEYLVWSGSKKGSMTPRLNLDGTVARCSE